MISESKFTAEDLTELLGNDLSLAASLAELIGNGGDIRTFLVKKLEEREEELARFHLSQAPRFADNREIKEILGVARSLGLHVY